MTFQEISKDSQEWDDIALSGGIVYVLSGEEEKMTPDNTEDYHFLWIKTGGKRRQGTLIMKGRTSKGRRLLGVGKIKKLSTDFSIDKELAVVLYRAAKKVRFGQELSVLEYVIKTKEDLSWKEFPTDGIEVKEWHKKYFMPETHLSEPRLSAAAKIIHRIYLQEQHAGLV